MAISFKKDLFAYGVAALNLAQETVLIRAEKIVVTK